MPNDDSSMPTAFMPKAKMKMLWRMLRTSAWDSRNSPGSGRSGSPISTMSTGLGRDIAADAAERDADVGRREGRRVVDSVAHHGDVSALSCCSFDPAGLVGGKQAGLDLVEHAQCVGHGAGRLRSIAGQAGRTTARRPVSVRRSQSGFRRGSRRERRSHRATGRRRRPAAWWRRCSIRFGPARASKAASTTTCSATLEQPRGLPTIDRHHRPASCSTRAHGPSTVARTRGDDAGTGMQRELVDPPARRDCAIRLRGRSAAPSRCSLRRSAMAATRSNSVSDKRRQGARSSPSAVRRG